jgi:hypothetical protein
MRAVLGRRSVLKLSAQDHSPSVTPRLFLFRNRVKRHRQKGRASPQCIALDWRRAVTVTFYMRLLFALAITLMDFSVPR